MIDDEPRWKWPMTPEERASFLHMLVSCGPILDWRSRLRSAIGHAIESNDFTLAEGVEAHTVVITAGAQHEEAVRKAAYDWGPVGVRYDFVARLPPMN